ncbi:hypothetical protein RCL1_003079 [Eukaryota sp. TZLM3-RCL]
MHRSSHFLKDLHPYTGPTVFSKTDVTLAFEETSLQRLLTQLSDFINDQSLDFKPHHAISLLSTLLVQPVNKIFFFQLNGITVLQSLFKLTYLISPDLISCVSALLLLPKSAEPLLNSSLLSSEVLPLLQSSNPSLKESAISCISLSLSTASRSLDPLILNQVSSFAPPLLLSLDLSLPSPILSSALCSISSLTCKLSVSSSLSPPILLGCTQDCYGVIDLTNKECMEKLCSFLEINEFVEKCLVVFSDLVKFSIGYNAVLNSNFLKISSKYLATSSLLPVLLPVYAFLSININGLEKLVQVPEIINFLKNFEKSLACKLVNNPTINNYVDQIIESIFKNENCKSYFK